MKYENMKKLLTSLFLFLFVQNSALAASSDSVDSWQAFVQGRFYIARDAGQIAQTADSLTTACRAGLVIGGHIETTIEATSALHGAITDCSNAHKIAPSHFDAQMSLAIALSFEGKRTFKPVYARTAKLLLEDLVIRYPENPIAHGALAAWHAQVSAAGFFARTMLKASRKKAQRFFETAFRKGTINFALQVEYLKFLALGSRAERQIAIGVAEDLLSKTPHMAFDTLLQKHCATVLKALKSGKKKYVKRAVQDMSAFSMADNWRDPSAYPAENLSLILPEKNSLRKNNER